MLHEGAFMHPPFTTEQFFEVFRRYNDAVWPAQVVLIAIALCAVYSAWRANGQRSWRWAQAALVLTSVLWLWSGIVYHKQFFARLTRAGEVFGSLFIAEGALLLLAATQNGVWFERASRSSRSAGILILTYALAIYPALAALLGQHAPAAPSFGVPCPTTIFTFGIFCLLPSAIPRFALVIPLLWAVIGTTAAFSFGALEDVGLALSAVVALVMMRHETHELPAARAAG
jgi:hypothetical protein